MQGGIGAVIMAAGAGRRMGYRPKCLLRLGGVPLIERSVRLLIGAGVAPVVVVLGHHAERIEPVLRRLQDTLDEPGQLQWVRNPDPDAGQGGSTRCGLAALPADLDGVLIALADQPLLEAADVLALLSAWDHRDEAVDLLLPEFDGQPGHPIIISAAVREAVMAASGAAGVREWRRAHPGRVRKLHVTHPRHGVDVDAPEDLATLAAQYGVRLDWADD